MDKKVLTKPKPELEQMPKPIMSDPIMIDSPQMTPVKNNLPRPLADKNDIPQPELSDYADFRGFYTTKNR